MEIMTSIGGDNAWNHYAVTQRGTAISFHHDGKLAISNDHPENTVSLALTERELTIGHAANDSVASLGFAGDFRAYDQVFLDGEIVALPERP